MLRSRVARSPGRNSHCFPLSCILTYRGVNALSTDLTDGQMVTTVNGQDVTISIMDGTVMINGTATVAVADLEAGNGVRH